MTAPRITMPDGKPEFGTVFFVYRAKMHTASSMDILAEIENLSRLTDRAIQIGARDAVQGPYTIISDPRHATGIYETIEDARPAAESTARRSTSGRAAIVNIVAEVALVPQWSEK